MVDFGGLVNKAKEWVGENPEKADGFVDKGAEALKGCFVGHEEQVDQFGNRLKDYLHPGHGEQPGEQAPLSPPEAGEAAPPADEHAAPQSPPAAPRP